MILRAGIIKKRIGSSQSISMDFIINHSLHGITENLNRKRSLSSKTKSDKQAINSIRNPKNATYFINLINEHAEIGCLRIITTQIWMARFHAIIICFLYLFWCGIRKLEQNLKSKKELKINHHLN